MGAWFSLLHDDETVTRAVLRSLETSAGSLTAPPLAVAAVLLADPEAAKGALAEYLVQDVLHEWGSAGFVGAAMEHLAGRVHMEPSDRDRSSFEQMHAIATAMRAQRGHPSA
jgi:hypothetical protein